MAASSAVADRRRTDVPAERRFSPRDGRTAAINQSLLILPILLTGFLFAEYASAHQLAVDFHNDFWVAGYKVSHGLSPYDWTRQQIAGLVSFPYPAPAALLFVPFTLLPRAAADGVFMTLTVVACLATLRVLRVRDWRLYGLVLLFWPVINGWQTANVTLLLGLGIAVIWRYRDSPAVAGALFAVMVSVKPAVWPLALWFLFTRRARTAAVGVALALVLNLIAWLVLGLGQVTVWLHLLSTQVDVLYRDGYGVTALAVHLGTGRTVGTGIQVAASLLLAGWCVQVARRGRERDAFTIAIGLMLVSSPLVDNHYFALLIVPLALARPCLSRLWAVPLALWLCPATGVSGWQVAVAWLITAIVVFRLVQEPSETALGFDRPIQATA
jgi:alpha-1,2-mannosyltransferase